MRVTQLYTPLCLSVSPSIGRSHFTFFMNFIFGSHCSCPNGLVTSNMAPAHPHATSVAVHPALFSIMIRPDNSDFFDCYLGSLPTLLTEPKRKRGVQSPYPNPLSYSTRIKELGNWREAISGKRLGFIIKFFTTKCTYRCTMLFKVLESFQ